MCFRGSVCSQVKRAQNIVCTYSFAIFITVGNYQSMLNLASLLHTVRKKNRREKYKKDNQQKYPLHSF